MSASTVVEVLKPWPMKLIVDYVLPGKPLPPPMLSASFLPGASEPSGLLVWLALSTILLFTTGQFLTVFQAYLNTGVGTRLGCRLGAVLLDHLQRLSLTFHVRQKTGDLVRRITTDCACLKDLLLGAALPALTALASLVAMFSVMWQLDRVLSILALLVLPVLGLLIRTFDRPMTERTYRHQQLEGEMIALAEQTLTALPVVQAFDRADREDQRFRGLTHRTLQAFLNAILAQSQFTVGVGSAMAMGTAAMMALGGYRVLAGEVTVGGLLVFLSYLASLYAPLEAIAYLTSVYTSVKARAVRVNEVLAASDAVRDAPDATRFPTRTDKKGEHVIFENVGFRYEAGDLVLRGLSFEARPGQTIALVGSTGAGKSTVLSLIPRFFDPCDGRILINGTDVKRIRVRDLRAHIGYVPQEPFLLPLSIAENIGYGRPGATREEITMAALNAQAHEFIRRLPTGYDTVIGERGATLSGGQKQRLAIARALLKDAPILILDEPTSALDSHTEASLMEALERLMAGRTTFIVAHRLSTIRNADRIILMERGAVVDIGTHHDLLERDPFYRRLWQLQQGASARTIKIQRRSTD